MHFSTDDLPHPSTFIVLDSTLASFGPIFLARGLLRKPEPQRPCADSHARVGVPGAAAGHEPCGELLHGGSDLAFPPIRSRIGGFCTLMAELVSAIVMHDDHESTDATYVILECQCLVGRVHEQVSSPLKIAQIEHVGAHLDNSNGCQEMQDRQGGSSGSS